MHQLIKQALFKVYVAPDYQMLSPFTQNLLF